jgi:pimeloyl-ACP methyl ester carboxylesterase
MTGLTRRTFLAGASTAAALTIVPTAIAQSQSGTTFVLVHGAWHGGWCWDQVADLMRAKGHHVFAPTLTGLGERSHLLSADVDLDTHITDILQVLKYEDLSDVVLVGHSYAGMVITGVADRNADRLGHLVYLDALLVESGQSMADLVQEDVTALANSNGVPPMLTVEQLGITDPKLAAHVKERLDPQPLGAMIQPLRYDRTVLERLPCTFIQTSELFAEEATEAEALGFRMEAIEGAGHDVMLTKPKALADLLMRI